METNSKRPDWDRIVHLFKLGIVASLIALVGGDMLLGWGTADIWAVLSRYVLRNDISS